MESLKQKVEQAIGASFIKWHNYTQSTNFIIFDSRGNDPPDLVYYDYDRKQCLLVEVTTSYYDSKDAIYRWNYARKKTKMPVVWSGENPDELLVSGISNRIKEKCLGNYEVSTVLIIEMYPDVTTRTEFDSLVTTIIMPESVPFTAIYVAGIFPESSDERGGYFCWELYHSNQSIQRVATYGDCR